MKTLFTLLLTIIVSVAIAQPTLTKHLKYNVGDEYSYFLCDTSGMSAGMYGGADTTWTITLNDIGMGVVQFLDKNSAQTGSQFPGANVVRFGGGMLYWIYQNTGTELRVLGVEQNGLPTAVLTPYYRKAIWPFTYNDSYTDTVPINYPHSSNVRKGIVYKKEIADGYGTLILNGKTYRDVLRTKSTNDGFDLSNSPVESIEQVRWYDTAHKTEILSIRRYESKLGTNPPPPSYEVVMRINEVTNIKATNNLSADISAYIRNDQLYLKGALESGKEYQVHLYNYSGQKVKSQTFTAKGHIFNTALPDMPTGIYFIQLQKRGEPLGYVKFSHQ